MAPTLYHFDALTGELSGTTPARANPKQEGAWLLPAFATFTAPPEVAEHEAAVYAEGAWTIVPDWRGHTYWLADRSKHKITELGIEPPAEALSEMPAPPFAEVKAAALQKIDTDAEAARMLFITPGEGQAWTYQRKEREAEAFMADASPDPADYPVLSACIPGDGADLAAVAQTVLAARDAWLQVGAAIEGIRRAAKTQVEAAGDVPAIQTILDGLSWPQP
ncbi:tail assembly chaperone gp38 [Tepidicaulis marinus]|uniref:Tail assembly chaperone gp38 n=1 Tax=Tepidicaulis marinus TaxID=1333998 RepID=A0A081B6C8_9HYPH|nr:hypothetical protein [Tepidicaulis marinus]GAK43596.1 tail assembly chaperone gp38 [Tepidicaulis marinus]